MKYRNDDPPDEPEHPECCAELMTIDGQVLRCEVCGRCQEMPTDPEESPEPFEEPPDDLFRGPEKCPHGNTWGDCDPCDYLSDLAYDASRERR
jgi:hypothetical protein